MRDVVHREGLRHNPLNEVTEVVERVHLRGGGTLVHKRLRAPGAVTPSDPSWAASRDPRHWNSWRREADAYADPALRASLEGTGLAMPDAEVEEHDALDDTVDLWLVDVEGVPGTGFGLTDHTALARGLGRWQAAGPLDAPWASRGFLRDYSTGKPAPFHLLDDDAAWQQPLVRDVWPAGLREGWQRLVAHRELLLTTLERLPRTRCHLDVWVSNQVRRPGGDVVLLDWAFAGDGAVGEDLGNHVPDAVFDLFWPAELDQACFEAHLAGLREAGWSRAEHPDTEVRLGVVAACVKYAWLLPRVLAGASDTQHSAYHVTADAERLFQQRGLAFAHLVGWCHEALAVASSS